MNSLYQLIPGMRFSCGSEDDGQETFTVINIVKGAMIIQADKTEAYYIIPINLTIAAQVEPVFENQLP